MYVGSLDLATGAITEVDSSVENYVYGKPVAATYAPPEGILYLALSNIGRETQIHAIEVATGTSSLLGEIEELPDFADVMSDLAYDPVGDRLLAATTDGFGASSEVNLYEVNRTNMEMLLLGTVDLVGSHYRVGLAVDPATGRPWLLSTQDCTIEQHFINMCLKMTTGLDLGDYSDAPTSVFDAEDGVVNLSGAQSSGPELIVFGGNQSGQNDASATLRIEVDNPEALVCILGMIGDLEIADTARFHGAVHANYTRSSLFQNITASIDAGFQMPSGPNFHVFCPDRMGNPCQMHDSIQSQPALFRIYDPEEWSDRRLPSFSAYVYPISPKTFSAWTLRELDGSTAQVLQTIDFNWDRLSETLTGL